MQPLYCTALNYHGHLTDNFNFLMFLKNDNFIETLKVHGHLTEELS